MGGGLGCLQIMSEGEGLKLELELDLGLGLVLVLALGVFCFWQGRRTIHFRDFPDCIYAKEKLEAPPGGACILTDGLLAKRCMI